MGRAPNPRRWGDLRVESQPSHREARPSGLFYPCLQLVRVEFQHGRFHPVGAKDAPDHPARPTVAGDVYGCFPGFDGIRAPALRLGIEPAAVDAYFEHEKRRREHHGERHSHGEGARLVPLEDPCCPANDRSTNANWTTWGRAPAIRNGQMFFYHLEGGFVFPTLGIDLKARFVQAARIC